MSGAGSTGAPVEVHTPRSPVAGEDGARRIALMGNPNTGKTTLFNRISGLRAKTSNFPGTTLEARITRVPAGAEGGRDGDLIDLPGIYSIELDQLEARVCREVLAGTSAPRGEPLGAPEVVVVVVDAANLARNLMLVGEVIRRRLPMVVVVNMVDVAAKRGIEVDAAALERLLGCGVVLTNARAGEGIDGVRRGIKDARIAAPPTAVPGSVQGLRGWAEEVFEGAVRPRGGVKCWRCGYVIDEGRRGRSRAAARCPECAAEQEIPETPSDRVDRVLLHPVVGLAVFAGVMTGLFYTLFVLAQFPMEWIEGIFGFAGKRIEAWLPEGAVRDLLANGIVGGVGATVVFLPQICLLFFLISLLEDTGYLARGAFLMNRLLRPFGLPGQSFVPLLSSHACALPGIMACRAIPDPKERLATILVAPFMTCSARLPVYVLLTSLLFAEQPAMAALAFVGCYVLGILAAVFSALIARRTILRGKSRPMAMELPCYKRPSVRTALLTTVDRAKVFLRSAGTNILMICIVLWWLGAYPKAEAPGAAVGLRAMAAKAEDRGDSYIGSQEVMELSARLAIQGAMVAGNGALTSPLRLEEVRAEADRLEARNQATHSFLGRIGRAVQPVFEPLGYDWQLSIGVLASFAAREVFVSTMSIVVSGQEEEDESLFEHLATATRDDGVTPIFTRATSWSLLVYYVLAMQCLPTLAVTAREAGGRKWALLQLVWMCGVAYAAAALVYALAA
ncbi:MAG: ferrous iron transporter B [Phycisphaerales bacterium]|nr:ferrous iron transporter B [Phycisphaerales bacterium]